MHIQAPALQTQKQKTKVSAARVLGRRFLSIFLILLTVDMKIFSIFLLIKGRTKFTRYRVTTRNFDNIIIIENFWEELSLCQTLLLPQTADAIYL